MLSCAGGNIDLATDCLRALEDVTSQIRCTGPVRDCPPLHRGYLVGQMYEVT
jgi:hypothetical protein